MRRGGDGVFSVRAEPGVAPVGSDYVYVLPRSVPAPDPVSRHRPPACTASRIVRPRPFAGPTPACWVARADLVIYELHVGTLSPEGRRGRGGQAPWPRELDAGPSAHARRRLPGRSNWGYDGVFPLRPRRATRTRRAEGPGRRLSRPRAGLILTSSTTTSGRRELPRAYAPYFTDRYRRRGATRSTSTADSDQVRRYRRQRAACRRSTPTDCALDAIQGIYDFGAPHPAELGEAFHARRARPGSAWLVAESDLNDPRSSARRRSAAGARRPVERRFFTTRPRARQRRSARLLGDFWRTAELAKAITAGFADGRHAPTAVGGTAPRGVRSGGSIVAFIQNHDQIANAYQRRSRGRRHDR